MTSEPNLQGELDRALAPVRQQLALDGYGLNAALAGHDVLHATVTAGPDACAECLVPKTLLAGMITSQINGEGITVGSVELTYPADR